MPRYDVSCAVSVIACCTYEMSYVSMKDEDGIDRLESCVEFCILYNYMRMR